MAEVRYRAFNEWFMGALRGITVALPCVMLLGIGALLLFHDSVVGVLAALACLVAAVLLAVVVVLGPRSQFIVDDEGMTIAQPFRRRRRIEWGEVAWIEQNTSYWWAGSVVVVLAEPAGERITVLATGDRMTMYRGENLFERDFPVRKLRPATRAAIDAHRRWLAASRR